MCRSKLTFNVYFNHCLNITDEFKQNALINDEEIKMSLTPAGFTAMLAEKGGVAIVKSTIENFNH